MALEARRSARLLGRRSAPGQERRGSVIDSAESECLLFPLSGGMFAMRGEAIRLVLVMSLCWS
jgi:hypothetical protein